MRTHGRTPFYGQIRHQVRLVVFIHLMVDGGDSRRAQTAPAAFSGEALRFCIRKAGERGRDRRHFSSAGEEQAFSLPYSPSGAAGTANPLVLCKVPLALCSGEGEPKHAGRLPLSDLSLSVARATLKSSLGGGGGR